MTEFEEYKRQSEKTIADKCREVNRLSEVNAGLARRLDQADTIHNLFTVLADLTQPRN